MQFFASFKGPDGDPDAYLSTVVAGPRPEDDDDGTPRAASLAFARREWIDGRAKERRWQCRYTRIESSGDPADVVTAGATSATLRYESACGRAPGSVLGQPTADSPLRRERGGEGGKARGGDSSRPLEEGAGALTVPVP